MLKRIAPVRVVCFCLMATCAALCQHARPAGGQHHAAGMKATKAKAAKTRNSRQQQPALRMLPDAPSPRMQSQTAKLEAADQVLIPVSVRPIPVLTHPAGGSLETHSSVVLPEAPSFSAAFAPKLELSPPKRKSDDFFSKYLSSAALNQVPRYQHSSNDKLMGRATDAAASIFLTRDDSGRRHINTPYFLRVLTSVAASSASRRYRARSNAAPLGDFGATIGNDAGMNLLHEFGPGLRQAMTSHMPQFVSRIEERVNHETSPRQGSFAPSR